MATTAQAMREPGEASGNDTTVSGESASVISFFRVPLEQVREAESDPAKSRDSPEDLEEFGHGTGRRAPPRRPAGDSPTFSGRSRPVRWMWAARM